MGPIFTHRDSEFEKSVKLAACDLKLQPEENFIMKICQVILNIMPCGADVDLQIDDLPDDEAIVQQCLALINTR